MEKVSLPTKTKIAARVMKFIGLFLKCFGFLMVLAAFYLIVFSTWSEGDLWGFFMFIYGVISLILGSLFRFIGSCLLKGKKKFWWINILTLFLITIISLSICIYQFLDFGFRWWMIAWTSPSFILLILLLLDRKNFWKIAE